jgi:hypothetical protein
MTQSILIDISVNIPEIIYNQYREYDRDNNYNELKEKLLEYIKCLFGIVMFLLMGCSIYLGLNILFLFMWIILDLIQYIKYFLGL